MNSPKCIIFLHCLYTKVLYHLIAARNHINIPFDLGCCELNVRVIHTLSYHIWSYTIILPLFSADHFRPLKTKNLWHELRLITLRVFHTLIVSRISSQKIQCREFSHINNIEKKIYTTKRESKVSSSML